MSFLQGNDPEFIKSRFDAIGVAYQPEAMGLGWSDVRSALTFMPEYWQKAGNLWYTAAVHLPITRTYLDEVQTWLAG
jgi:hypothetical protein